MDTHILFEPASQVVTSDHEAEAIARRDVSIRRAMDSLLVSDAWIKETSAAIEAEIQRRETLPPVEWDEYALQAGVLHEAALQQLADWRDEAAGREFIRERRQRASARYAARLASKQQA